MKKSFNSTNLLALTTTLILSLLVTPAFAESIDQSNDVSRDHVCNRGTFGQSFTPTMKFLTKVDLALDSEGNTRTYTVTLNIRNSWGGTILGTATAIVPPGIRNQNIGEFVSFVFSTPIELTPATQYIIEVNLEQYYHQGGTNDMISWYIHDTDSYPGGTAIQNGYVLEGDMVFRTWGTDVLPVRREPVGGEIISLDFLSMLMPYIMTLVAVTTLSLAMTALIKHRLF